MTQFLWSQRSNFGPRGRRSAGMAFDTGNKCVLLFGGFADPVSSILNDTWQWDGSAWVQVSDMGPSFPALTVPTFAMIYVPSRTQMVLLVAKRSQAEPLSPCQTWIWDGQEWTQVADLGPSNPIMCAYDQIRDRIVVLTTDFAGPMQTWEWDGLSWTQVADGGPPPRKQGALAYDAERRHTVLFGGADDLFVPVGDTWGWDGQIWRQLAAFGPRPRYHHGMVYDSARKCIVLFGGFVGITGERTIAPPDTWEWDGKKWTQRQDIGPSRRIDAAMAFDSARNRIVLFGGSGDIAFSGETWEYMQWPPSASPIG